MSHLEDRLAEFVFEELPPDEMGTARHHVAQCLDCQARVSDFRQVRHRLEQLPSMDPPRRVVFVPEARPASASRGWTRWFPPVWAVPGIAAAVLVGFVLMAGGVSVDWAGGGVQVGLGLSEPVPPASPVAAQEAPVDYDNLDYERITAGIEADVPAFEAALARYRQDYMAEIELLASRIDALDTGNQLEILRVRSDLSRMYDTQQSVMREFYGQGAALQMVAERVGLE